MSVEINPEYQKELSEWEKGKDKSAVEKKTAQSKLIEDLLEQYKGNEDIMRTLEATAIIEDPSEKIEAALAGMKGLDEDLGNETATGMMKLSKIEIDSLKNRLATIIPKLEATL